MHQNISKLKLNFNFPKFIIFLYFSAHKIDSIDQTQVFERRKILRRYMKESSIIEINF